MKRALLLLVTLLLAISLFSCAGGVDTDTPTGEIPGGADSALIKDSEITSDSEVLGSDIQGGTLESDTLNSTSQGDTTPTIPDSTLENDISSGADSTLDSDTGNEDKPTTPTVKPNFRYKLSDNYAAKYKIVYDDSDSGATYMARELHKLFLERFEVEFEIYPVSEAKTAFSKEIVIGNKRVGYKVKNMTEGGNDFAMALVGDDYYLYATGKGQYEYMLHILENTIFNDCENGTITVETRDDFVYHESEYKDKSYLDILMEKQGLVTFTKDFLLQIFEPREFVASDGTTLKYRIYVPYDYDATKEYPIVTVLHGAGERGNDNESQMKHLILPLFSQNSSPILDSIVICPQCPDGQQWVDTPWLGDRSSSYSVERVKESNENKAVLELISKTESEVSIDTSRRYLMGLSMGGFGVWDLMMRHSEMFASMVAFCGSADPSQAQKLIDKPIYTIHGNSDNVVHVDGTRQMVEAIQNAGGKSITYIEISGGGHTGAWGYVNTHPEVLNWLFECKNSTPSEAEAP